MSTANANLAMSDSTPTLAPRRRLPLGWLLVMSAIMMLVAGGASWWRSQDIDVQVTKVGGRFQKLRRLNGGEQLVVTILGRPVDDSYDIDLQDSIADDAWLRRNRDVLASLTDLRLLLGARITDAGLQLLRGMENIVVLGVQGESITNAGFEHILTLKNIRNPGIAQTAISDDELPGLCQLSSLQYHAVDHSQITELSVKGLAQCTSLRSVGISDATDETVSHLRHWSSLSNLTLIGVGVTDTSVPSLSAMTSLKRLTLLATSVSDEGLRTLQEALPACRVERRHGMPAYNSPIPEYPL